ncbi:uncharacterized protein LOC116347004 isoform X1 [Contarinia nasturtii]|uniref:uncharacterized protein LOC116347004 isoform X1 n=1 Tax=Contarinia nasturtii TaxID=265458 RepID=UPI0012D46101|nr:uncharacterized protein LOC116347004 isoform X1 [Contarinia nasturtii]
MICQTLSVCVRYFNKQQKQTFKTITTHRKRARGNCHTATRCTRIETNEHHQHVKRKMRKSKMVKKGKGARLSSNPIDMERINHDETEKKSLSHSGVSTQKDKYNLDDTPSCLNYFSTNTRTMMCEFYKQLPFEVPAEFHTFLQNLLWSRIEHRLKNQLTESIELNAIDKLIQVLLTPDIARKEVLTSFRNYCNSHINQADNSAENFSLYSPDSHSTIIDALEKLETPMETPHYLNFELQLIIGMINVAEDGDRRIDTFEKILYLTMEYVESLKNYKDKIRKELETVAIKDNSDFALNAFINCIKYRSKILSWVSTFQRNIDKLIEDAHRMIPN